MKIRVHLPETEEGIQQLKMKVAELHAEAIMNCIHKLPCEAESKMQLFNLVKDEIKKRAGQSIKVSV